MTSFMGALYRDCMAWFKKKKKIKAPVVELVKQESYTIKVRRNVIANRSISLTAVPRGPFAEIDEWCNTMGLGTPSTSCSFDSFAFPLHLVNGDSVEFTLSLGPVTPEKATMFKLRFGGLLEEDFHL